MSHLGTESDVCFFLRIFFKFFGFSLHIFKSTCRITPIFLLKDSLKSGECFRYPQHIFLMCFWVSTSSESQKFASKLRNFYNPLTYFSSLFKAFFKIVLIFLAYFQKYASYRSDFFYQKITWSLESVLDTHSTHFECVFGTLQALKIKKTFEKPMKSMSGGCRNFWVLGQTFDFKSL